MSRQITGNKLDIPGSYSEVEAACQVHVMFILMLINTSVGLFLPTKYVKHVHYLYC